jgi:hypothetical protein
MRQERRSALLDATPLPGEEAANNPTHWTWMGGGFELFEPERQRLDVKLSEPYRAWVEVTNPFGDAR